MKNFDINEDPHRRYNPLINEWVWFLHIVQNVLGKDKRKFTPMHCQNMTHLLLVSGCSANGMVNLDYKK
jgi:UDPglucose--hexose-1-phosphate uridylyltransferase